MLSPQQNFPIALTFDIDWAPEFAIKQCIEILRRFDVPATFFVTHSSQVMSEIASDPNFEIGIHPNFLQQSTHGNSVEEIMDTVLGFAPHAVSMRTHGLFQSSNLFYEIIKKYPSIKNDVSLYIPSNPLVRPFVFASEDGYINRFPYAWEDDLFFPNPKRFSEEIVYSHAYYQIFDFHPIHVCLNSSDMKSYKKLRDSHSCALIDISEKDAHHAINSAIGCLTWLQSILTRVSKERFVKISELEQLVS